jgi:LPS-assembly lipoprotein
MSSSDTTPDRRRFIAALSGLWLIAGCGFAPAYGTDGAALALRNTTAIEAPATVEGYRLRERLQDRLGQAQSASYLLSVTLDIDQIPVAVSSGQGTARYDLPGSASWVLREAGSDAVLAQGQVDSFTGFLATGSTVATLTAENDARARLAVILADQIMARLMMVAPTLPSR